MRNVIIVEERFEARGTQRGLALPTAAFADSSSLRVHWSLGAPAPPALWQTRIADHRFLLLTLESHPG